MLEASTLLGLLIPGELAVLVGGLLVHFHKLPLVAALAAAIGGAVLGDSLGYTIGRRYGERIRRSRIGRWIGKDRWRRADKHLERRGVLDVIVARFPPVLRTLVPGAAGMAKMPYRRFLVANLIGGSVWATVSVLAGVLAAREWHVVEKAERWLTCGALVALVAFVVYLVMSRRRRQVTGT